MSFDWGVKTLPTQIVGDGRSGEVVTFDNPRWPKAKLTRIRDLQRAISALEEASRKTSGKTRRLPVNVRMATPYRRLRKICGQIARQRRTFTAS